MFRSMFIDLEWSTLEEDHGGYWKKLRAKYDLSVDQFSRPKSLDDLAMQCIRICRQILFQKSLPGSGKLQPEVTPGVRMSDFLEEHLTQALVDHLVVSFAHRFCVENVEPRDMRECLEDIFACQNLFLQPEIDCEAKANSKQEERDAKRRTFCASNLKRLETYHQGMDGFISAYKLWLGEDLRAGEGSKLPQYEVAALNREKAAIDACFQKADMFAAPNWIYTMVMMNNWTNHPFNIKKKGLVFSRDFRRREDLLEKLASFLGDNPWMCLLLSDQGKAQPIPSVSTIFPNLPFELQTGIAPAQTEDLFVGVRYEADNTFKQQLDAHKYILRGTDTQIELSTAVQFMFNSYLIERSFHGHAIATLLARIAKIEVEAGRSTVESYGEPLSRYSSVPYAIRVHAPLIHSALIQVLMDIASLKRNPSASTRAKDKPFDLDWFVFQWNTEALPVLEELFVMGVYTYFKYDGLWNQIEGSLLDTNGLQIRRCERLNYYRMVKVPEAGQENRPKVPNSDYIRSMSRLIWSGYRAGIGLRQYRDDYSGRLFDPEVHTVLDDKILTQKSCDLVKDSDSIKN